MAENASSPYFPSLVDSICIVGGGPVGLYTALQLKIKIPYARVMVVEQYKQYQRTHTVHLSDDWIWAECYLYPFMIQQLNVDQHNIQDLEQLLLDYCRHMGVEIVNEKITKNSWSDPKAFWNQAQILIGADGAKSILREIFFQNKLQHKDTVSHVVKVQWNLPPAITCRKMDWITSYKALKKIHHLISEHKHHNNLVWFINVTPNEFEYFQHANLKTPMMLSSCDKTHPVIQDLYQWAEIRHQQGFDSIKITDETATLTGIRLNLYAAEKIVKIRPLNQFHTSGFRQAQLVFLVGDAAMGAPYFQALNIGFRCSNYLVKALLEKNIQFYANNFQTLVTETVQKTQVKTYFFDFLQWWIQISSKVPWQVIKF